VKGWQFFPERPAGPVDGAYVQRRWVRPYRVGALRWLLAAGVGLVTAYAAFAGLLLVYSSQTVADVVVAGLVALLGVGALGWVTARVLSVGVWVNDAGVRVLSVTRTRQTVGSDATTPNRSGRDRSIVPGRGMWQGRKVGLLIKEQSYGSSACVPC